MKKSPRVIFSEDFGKILSDAGILPANVRRFIIDAEIGNAVMIYYECFGDERLLELNLPEALSTAMSINVNDMEIGADEISKG